MKLNRERLFLQIFFHKRSLDHTQILIPGVALLPEVERREGKSIYLYILSQIALVQAMQQKFDIAHQTVDEAVRLLEPQYQ